MPEKESQEYYKNDINYYHNFCFYFYSFPWNLE